jgi:hypothetical protein
MGMCMARNNSCMYGTAILASGVRRDALYILEKYHFSSHFLHYQKQLLNDPVFPFFIH